MIVADLAALPRGRPEFVIPHRNKNVLKKDIYSIKRLSKQAGVPNRMSIMRARSWVAHRTLMSILGRIGLVNKLS
jgi:hypothetical protein